jgi:hypothetical protein
VKAIMPDYRAYIVGSDGHFHSFEIITAPDDETAVEKAKGLVDRSGVEVWDLDRKIAVLPPK